MTERRFYVYVYFRLSGVPCYVGKGTGDRWKMHETRCSNPHLAAILKRSGGSLPKLIVRDGLTNTEAIETEIALIAAIGRETNGGPLVNLSDGGEGPTGCVRSAESRARMSTARRSLGPDWQARNNAARAEAMRRPEVREKIGAVQRGKPKKPPKVVEKKTRKAPRKRGPLTESVKRKLSAATAAWWAANPGARNFTAEHRENLRRTARERADRAGKESELL